MRVIITTGLLCAAIGAAVGWMNAADHYEDKARKLLESTAKAEQMRADKSKEITDELYEKWRDAIVIPEPVTVVERLYVKAKCPVQADRGGEVDHDSNGIRVELESGIVRGVERVADKHERLYKRCATQLKAAQALLKAE